MSKIDVIMDDLLTDFESLRMSALKNAAKVSQSDRDQRSVKRENGLMNGILMVTIKNDKKSIPASEQLSNEDIPNDWYYRAMEILDTEILRSRAAIKATELKEKERVRKFMNRRQKISEKEHQEVKANLEEERQKSKMSSQLKLEEDEKEIVEVIRQEERKMKIFEDEQRVKLEMNRERLKDLNHELNVDKQNRMKHTYVEKIQANQSKFFVLYESFTLRLKTKELNPSNAGHFHSELSRLLGVFNSLLVKANGGELNESSLEMWVKMVTEMELLIRELDQEHENFVEQKRRDAAEKIEMQNVLLNPKPVIVQHPQPVVQAPPQDTRQALDVVDQSVAPSSPPSQVVGLESFVAKERMETFCRVSRLYEEYYGTVAPFFTKQFSKLRFDCMKVIQVSVNAITSHSSEHLTDKFVKLDSLLSGQPFTCSGTQISAADPLVRRLCVLLMAEKFVNQGGQAIDTKIDTAFPFAAVIVALWQKHPDFGELFLFFLYKACPYLIPYFIPQLEGVSDKDYHKQLGYRYDEDGKLEDISKFMKRMIGYVRLYAAVIITRPRRDATSQNPHSLDEGWSFLCHFIRLEANQMVCAKILEEFLKITGAALFQNYKRQFIKLLKTIQNYAQCRLVDDTAKAMLAQFLEKVFSEGGIPPPTGQLAPNFW